ncbi:MAG: peptide chain release factor N(5)-glutamine methyltransferase, partial [Rhodocyclaceae bacterium]|nr:peptide chain release factor N(5)-glutamine methyltransferase [Rhodocyclaceae bacterium]
ELLVDWALGKAKREEAPRILDLGTGSGCIAVTLALELPRSRVTAVDLSKAALAVAADNAGRHGARVDFRHGDWFSAVTGEGFDLIVANPPYVAEGDGHLAEGDVRFEPRSALAAGSDGLDDIRRIVGTASGHLGPEGWLAVEHGWDQGEKCAEIFRQSHYRNVVQLTDLSGIMRITAGLVNKVTILRRQ